MGQIDILVNVAGVNCRKPSTEITEEDWDAVLNLNLKALFFTSQAVGRYWLETRRFAAEHNRGKGKIINIGSIAGAMSIRSVAPYAASKRGVLGVTSTLAVEWAAEGICVNCLAPGYIETDLTRARFDDPAFTTAFRWAGAVIQPISLELRFFSRRRRATISPDRQSWWTVAF